MQCSSWQHIFIIHKFSFTNFTLYKLLWLKWLNIEGHFGWWYTMALGHMGADKGEGARNLPPVDFEKKLKLKKEGNVQNNSTKI
jgi:hypothetical protein